MAPKKSAKAPGGGADKDGAQEEPLAAVILADTFSRAFAPLDVSAAASSSAESIESCALLRPFLNVPLLSLHLRALSLARVEQVYILSISHADVLREHLTAHPAPPGMEVTTVRTPEARSVGDSLREIDARQVIRGEFLLVQPDAIVGMDLAAIVEAHRARKLKDKDTAMTLCAMQVGENARSRGLHAPLHVLNGNSQLLHYAAHGVGKAVEIPNEVLFLEEKEGGDGELEVRADLVEAGIDVCGAEVPPLFSENFDYQSLRGDFVPGILTSDLLDSKIFMHVCGSSSGAAAGPSVQKNGYGARASSTRAYDAITRDVLAGAAHPLVPSSNIWPGERLEKRGRALVGAGVALDDTTVLGPGTLVAGGAKLGADVRLARSVIGPSVSVGAHTAIRGSHVWHSVTIGERCSLDRSIVASGATLLDGVVLGRGCLIGPGCVVGPNVTLPPFSRVGAREHGDDDDEEWSGNAATPKTAAAVDPALGAQGKGFLWPRAGEGRAAEDDDDDDEEELDAPLHDYLGAEAGDIDDDASDDASSIGGDSELLDEWDGSSMSSVEDADMHEGAVGASLIIGGDGANGDETAADRAEANARLADFKTEAVASLKRAFEEGHTTDNAAIELKTLRMASNVPLSEVRQVAISFILDRCDAKDGKQTGAILDRWGPLIETVASDDEIEAVAMMQTYCALHTSHAALFVPLLKKLYNDDLVSDEAIVAWWRSPAARDGSEARGGEAALELRRRAEPIVRFILESAEDSEEESDEE